MKKNICIIGAFDFMDMNSDGQTVKTRELYYSLCKQYGENNITYIETFGWKNKPFKILKEMYKNVKRCNIFIMLPAHNGVEVFSRLLVFCKKYKDIQIFYDVIGGWLPEKTKKHPRLLKYLKYFDGIWVETSSMLCALNKQGLNNIYVLPNYKNLNILSEQELENNYLIPFKVCTFSRVIEKKGIEDAIEAINKVNKDLNTIVFHLDIYGPIGDSFSKKFEELKKNNRDVISYKGVISPSESVNILKDYYALLFPTRFYTEGIPGTIIDAYASGVPVITTLWQNYQDIFVEGSTGWGYDFGDQEEFVKVLKKAAQYSDEFLKMKPSCLKAAWKYHSNTVIKQIDKLIRDVDLDGC